MFPKIGAVPPQEAIKSIPGSVEKWIQVKDSQLILILVFHTILQINNLMQLVNQT